MPQVELFENEKIKQINGFPNYYVTTFGRVWSEKTHRWLKPTINKGKYHKREYVSLGRGNKRYIHRLVATAFIPNPDNCEEVDHIDTNELNNHVENLRWVTHKQNMENNLTIEHVKRNTGYYCEIEDIETGEKFAGYAAIAEHYKVHEATVLNHTKNRVKNPKWRLTDKRIRPEN